jgi:lysophospholipase L1-like esterase
VAAVHATTLNSRQNVDANTDANANANANAATVGLRIMPVGASVTFGVGSSTGNSYRKDLFDKLAVNGRQVEMVGTVKNGNFAQNSCEGFSGFVISQLAAKAESAAPQFKPNLVLLEAGTNNCNRGGTVPDAGKNVTALINRIFAQSPGVTVVLATILRNPDAQQDACRQDINRQFQQIAGNLGQGQGQGGAARNGSAKFVLVDMRGSQGPTVNDLADKRHPNDAGYAKMAAVWMQGIQEAQTRGLFSAASQQPAGAAGAQQGTSGATDTVAAATSSASAFGMVSIASVLTLAVGLPLLL